MHQLCTAEAVEDMSGEDLDVRRTMRIINTSGYSLYAGKKLQALDGGIAPLKL